MEGFLLEWGPGAASFWVRALWAFAIIVVAALIGARARGAMQNSLQRARVDPTAGVLLGRIIRYGILSFGILVALAILGIDITALAAVIGFATVGLGVSLQDIFRNIIAGLYLLIERPFRIGNTIEVGGQRGVIQSIELRTTTLTNEHGERVIVPNQLMFTSVVVRKNNAKEPA